MLVCNSSAADAQVTADKKNDKKKRIFINFETLYAHSWFPVWPEFIKIFHRFRNNVGISVHHVLSDPIYKINTDTCSGSKLLSHLPDAL